ncbi:F-box protein SKIP23-like [Corylus avellana]|uniref:F-box protein SKIP23-like n=1 Tax=Corylus avellana TaxID=13451 RepID=UPI00286A1FBC|nr:F-box protein SKIP23-like [Corylus avellana]
MVVDWTQLPQELLKSISDSIKIYADYIHFRAVCHSVRSSVPNTPRHLPPQLPWLMLPNAQSDQSDPAFLDLQSAGKLHHLEIPEDVSHHSFFCGSSHGWLVLLFQCPGVLLFNPLTQASLELPPFSAPSNEQSFNFLDVDINDPLGEMYMHTFRGLIVTSVRKVVFSSSPLSNNFIALAIISGCDILAYCKKGDLTWTLIPRTMFCCEDVIYFNDLFHVVDKHGALAVCDVNGASPIVSFINPPLLMGGDTHYLVNSGDDELLLVTRYVDMQYGDVDTNEVVSYKTLRFEVFRMNWGEPRWETVTSLGDRMLFIGENSSVSFLASDFRGCSGNCIYFTDDSDFKYYRVHGDYDLGIFKLLDGSIEKLPSCQRNPDSKNCWPPTWVTPNPC